MSGGSAPRRAGTKFESACRDFIQTWGFPHCERAPLWGGHDRGDLLGIPGFVIQCRNTARLDLAGAIDDAKTQAANNGSGRPVAIIRRRGTSVAGAYVVMELCDWLEVIR